VFLGASVRSGWPNIIRRDQASVDIDDAVLPMVAYSATAVTLKYSSLRVAFSAPCCVSFVSAMTDDKQQEQQQKRGGRRPDESEHVVAAATGQQELVNR